MNNNIINIRPEYYIHSYWNKEFNSNTSFDCINHISKEEIEAKIEEFSMEKKLYKISIFWEN